MSSFSGSRDTFLIGLLPANLTISLENGVEESMVWPLALMSEGASGDPSGAIPSATVHRTADGSIDKMFGGRLFERIIVIPRNKGVGFVLSSTQFPVEVWNTFEALAESLTAINISGSGGITIPSAPSLPHSIGPKDSLILQALLPAAGDVNIAQTIEFVFSGISGTTAFISGSRILVFSVAPDWADGMKEKFSYLTDVFQAFDDSEQRRGLRSVPRRSNAFTAKAMDAQQSAGMESLVWGWQHQPYGVPFWQDAQPLLADVGVGEFSIEVNTVDRSFAPGGIAAIWQDEFTFEALTIDTITDGSITFKAPTQFAWKAGAGSKIVPVFLGRLSNSLDVDRDNSILDSIGVEFAGEAGQIGSMPTATFPQFKGFDVLEIAPNWVNGLKRNYARSVIALDPATGPITVDDKGGTAIVSHDLPWWIEKHSDVTKLRAFLNARQGQLVPFWTPTFDSDLQLSGDVLANSSILNIKTVFYTRFFFPNRSRRFLALISLDGTANRYVEITGSADNGDGTESLTMAAPLVAGAIADRTMVSFMTFCRCGSDEFEIQWDTTDAATATVNIRELPRELPT